MPDQFISAPQSIAPMVGGMKTVSVGLGELMARLAQETATLRASGTTGRAVEAFDRAQLLWQQTGQGEAARTAHVAKASDDYLMNMQTADRMGEAMFDV